MRATLRKDLPIDLSHRHTSIANGMKQPFSHAKQYIAQLKHIEQQISQNQLQEAALELNSLARTAANDPRLFLLGSRLAEAARNPTGMLEAARKAHQLAPQWPIATLHLAAVLASRGEAGEAGEAVEALAMAEHAVRQATQMPVDSDLLTKAAAVAQRLNQHLLAMQWLRQAEKASPDDLNIRYKIGLTLVYAGESASAVEIFTDILRHRPADPALLIARMQAYLGTQQTEQAIRDGEVLLGMEPESEVYQFYLDIARGITPKTQPVSVVVGLFDGYAARFDRHLVVQLHYKLPRDVAQLIGQWHPDRKGDVLDLGCGTGLLGACLGPIEGVLVGVDLSGEMIEHASRHGVYDSFHRVNLLDALQATPENLYHVITALDVLGYVGSLDIVIPNAHRILVPGGRFVFSCEAGVDGGADYALPTNYRYTHQRSYVQHLLEEAGFEDIEIEDRVLRFEAGEPVSGFLVTARKPPAIERKTARKRMVKSD